MNSSLLAFVVLIFLIFGLLLYFWSRNSRTNSNSYIHIFIIFPKLFTIDADELSNAYIEQWGHSISVSKVNSQYKVTNNSSELTLELQDFPLPSSFIEMLTSPFYRLNEDEAIQVKNHKSSINLQVSRTTENQQEQTLFVAQVLLSVLRKEPPVGLVNVAAQYYHPVRRLEAYNSKTSLQPEDMYLLFVSVQQVDNEGSYWFHTHGLEQFGVPNFEIEFSNKDDEEYYQSVIESASVYLIARGDIIKSGSTLSIMGDGINFQATLRKDKEFPTGVLTLSRL